MATMMQRFVLAARPVGAPRTSDFRLETLPLPACPAGGVVVQVLWQSLDPYMRSRMNAEPGYSDSVRIGQVMIAGGVGRVIASDAAGLAPGDIVQGLFGWATHAAVPAAGLRKIDPDLAPLQAHLGPLGLTGFTAWHGLNGIGRPRPGETIVVSAASGAVGSIVGQLARRQGLRVVGVAGGAEKCRHVVRDLGFDACVDHRAAPDAQTLRADLARACPGGVDIYFENVGGKTLDAVLPLMNLGGRIPICGMISQYNSSGAAQGPDRLPQLWRELLFRRLTASGFIISDHYDRFPDFLAEVAPLVQAGSLVWKEWIVDGIEAAPQAFIDMLDGRNFGKTLVRMAPVAAG